MVVAAFELGLHVVLVGAAGGKIDPTAVRVADLTEVTNDKLLRRVRQQLRKEHGFPAGDTAARSSRRAVARRWGVPCVYSVEASETTAQGEGLSATGSAPLASRPARLASPPPRTSPPRSQGAAATKAAARHSARLCSAADVDGVSAIADAGGWHCGRGPCRDRPAGANRR